VVRPVYAGGRSLAILKAFRKAKEKVEVGTLVSTLRMLQFVYPYHQAIGFYMESAGYMLEQIEPLRRPGIQFDFYLAHEMHDPAYDARWRVHYPNELRGAGVKT